MDNSQILKVILTSSLIAGILSAIVSAIVSIILKKIDYRNEYYKILVHKRLNAYEFLERQIAVLKISVLDSSDGKAYYMIFDETSDEFHNYQKNLVAAMAYSIWINTKTVTIMEDLNGLFYQIGNLINEDNIIEIGKKYYDEIFILRKKLEISVRKDLLNLYKLEKLNKSIKKDRTRQIEI